MTGKLSRRMAQIGLVVALVGLVMAAACAPAAPLPTPTAVPTPVAKAPPPTATLAPPTPTPTKGPPVKVKLAFSSKTDSQAPLFLAEDKGYYREEGLDLELIQIASAVSVKALVAGGHEFDSSTGSAQLAILEGAPLKAVAIFSTTPPWSIYVRPEIKTLEDLRGKRIAVTAVGSSLDQTAGRVLRKRGIDPLREVIWQGVGPGRARITALEAGAVDAIVIDTLTAGDIEAKGYRRLIKLGDEVKGTYTGLATHDRIIREKPHLVKSVVRAEAKAVKLYKSLSPEVRAWLEKFYAEMGITDKARATRLYEEKAGEWVDVRTLTEAFLKQDIDNLREDREIKEEIPVDRVFNLTFAREAAQELEGWKP